MPAGWLLAAVALGRLKGWAKQGSWVCLPRLEMKGWQCPAAAAQSWRNELGTPKSRWDSNISQLSRRVV